MHIHFEPRVGRSHDSQGWRKWGKDLRKYDGLVPIRHQWATSFGRCARAGNDQTGEDPPKRRSRRRFADLEVSLTESCVFEICAWLRCIPTRLLWHYGKTLP